MKRSAIQLQTESTGPMKEKSFLVTNTMVVRPPATARVRSRFLVPRVTMVSSSVRSPLPALG